MDSICSGKASCEYIVGTQGLNEFNPCLSDVTAYLEVGYDCVKGMYCNRYYRSQNRKTVLLKNILV